MHVFVHNRPYLVKMTLGVFAAKLETIHVSSTNLTFGTQRAWFKAGLSCSLGREDNTVLISSNWS